jgi:hypothetical protein
MKVVNSLRKALPSMQFLVTTHDPLCLRGIGEGEVAVTRRNTSAEVVAMTDLPSPGDLEVDQLLTSDFFGLNSTKDQEVEAFFTEYYTLLARPEPGDKKPRLDFLREELEGRGQLGATLRESLVYEAIDRVLANHRRDPIPRTELKESAVEAVSKIWNRSRSE